MKHALNIVLLGLLAFSLAGCGEDDNPVAPESNADDSGLVDRFEGDFAADRWSSSGIFEGTTGIDPETGATDTLVFTYAVSRSGGGISTRTSDFAATAPADGVVVLDWRYHGFHAWHQARVQGTLYAESPAGMAVVPLVEESTVGYFTFEGNATIAVFEGMDYGFELGGSNYDSDSRILGDFTVTDFRFVPADPPAGD